MAAVSGASPNIALSGNKPTLIVSQNPNKLSGVPPPRAREVHRLHLPRLDGRVSKYSGLVPEVSFNLSDYLASGNKPSGSKTEEQLAEDEEQRVFREFGF